ncbi:phosphate acyltransferase PlsX [Micromonospora sp. NPDC049559]|uniref:phosphate acyltransferase PlsX n=1 Tax=Micromonospora sp. NPDC049559 TaxID=3155923 RepID=UPI0034452A73
MEPGTVRIAVDLLGGDKAPAVVVDGALRAFGADPDLQLLLVGPPEAAGGFLSVLSPTDRARVTVVPAYDVAGMTDDAARASRPGTSVAAAVATVVDGSADAVVSAGATGATVTASALGLGRWPGVRRPALVATLPAVAGPVVLVDVGGSLEARPTTLARHAVLGAAYTAVAHGTPEPRVGLLSIGTEPGKGDRARRAADPVLAAQALPGGARYIGLVEGYDVALGERADVVVTDGFTGNVLLKAIEGAYALAGGPPTSGGAPRAAALLGVGGTVVACHGAARDDDIASGIALAAHLHRRGAVAAIAALLADAQGRLDDAERSGKDNWSGKLP